MKKLLSIIFVVSYLTGCTKIEELQYQAYAVGIGVEYRNDEYHVVLQFLDFSNVAKTDQGKSDQANPVWLGEGKGKTLEDAILQIYHGIQIPINYDQISVFVFGKSVLEKKLAKIVESLDTNFSIRLTGWVYGTEEPIKKIFTTKLPFNYAYSNSRIVQPEYMQQHDSLIPTISLQELIYKMHEKPRTILVPRISTNNEIIKKDVKQLPVTVMNGAYIIKEGALKGYLDENDLKGFIRVNNQAVRSPVVVSPGKGQFVEVELLNPRVKRRIDKDQNGVKIGLDINISAIVRESSNPMISPQLKKQIIEKIRNEVYEAYEKGQKIGGDIYQFEDYMYRFMHDDWLRLQKTGEFPFLEKNAIHVKVEPLKSINRINAGIPLPFD